ncbi:MAG: SRPBCC family protein [Synechococcales bacterium]|nr:SRPBCC family protein [Synechococcales bacterium]
MDAMNPDRNLFPFAEDVMFTEDPTGAAEAPLVDYGELDAEWVNAIEVQTEQLAGRQRRIAAQLLIPREVERVWQVLTDYEHLADFIPNLAKSQRLEHPEGGIRIEQVGSQRLLKFNFRARVVLDMVEQAPHRLDFQMVEGDFKSFAGHWQLDPAESNGRSATLLGYTLFVTPTRLMPVNLIERRLGQGLRVNLAAIYQRSNELFA